MISFIERVFSGRLGRKVYFFGFVLTVAVLIGALMALRVVGSLGGVTAMVRLVLILLGIFYILSLQVRRLHDLGYTGFVALLSFAPGFNIALWLYLFFGPFFTPVEQGINEYGPRVQDFSMRYVFLGRGTPKPFIDHRTGAPV